MRRLLLVPLGALTLSLTLAGPARAGADFYLKLDGVEGEASAAGSSGALAVASWSFGATQTGSMSMGGAGSGRRVGAAPAAEPAAGSSGSLTLTRRYDKASPLLAKRCAEGQHIASAQLTRCENGACRTYELKDVVISSVAISNDGGKVTETLSFNYGKIEWAAAPPAELRESPTRASTGRASVSATE
jgi:type VI secretion system secreted protein Hcp